MFFFLGTDIFWRNGIFRSRKIKVNAVFAFFFFGAGLLEVCPAVCLFQKPDLLVLSYPLSFFAKSLLIIRAPVFLLPVSISSISCFDSQKVHLFSIPLLNFET